MHARGHHPRGALGLAAEVADHRAEWIGRSAKLGAVLGTPGVMVMSVTNAILTVIQTGVLVFLFPLYLVTRGGFGPTAVGLLTSASILGRLAALWLGGSISDRWGRMRVLTAGLLAYAAVVGSVPFLTHPVALSLWSFALGAAGGFVAPLPTAVIADRVPPPLQGLAIGWLRTMTDTGQIVGPLVMGACADAVGLSTPFHLGAVLLMAAAWRCRRDARGTPAVVDANGALVWPASVLGTRASSGKSDRLALAPRRSDRRRDTRRGDRRPRLRPRDATSASRTCRGSRRRSRVTVPLGQPSTSRPMSWAWCSSCRDCR